MAIENLEVLRDRHLDCMLALAFSAANDDDQAWSEADEAMSRRVWVRSRRRFLERRRAKRRAACRRGLHVAAALIMALALIAPVALTASAELRARVLRLLMEHTPTHMEVKLVEASDLPCEVPEAWQGEWYPSFVPQRFSTRVINDATGRIVDFLGESGNLGFMELDENTESDVNTEGGSISVERVNGIETTFVTRPKDILALWSVEGRYFIMTIYDENGADAREFREIVAGVVRVAE